MRRLPAALLLATALVATPCLAASSTRMSWDHCAADGRVANRTFACDTNAGSELLVGSFEMDQASTQVSGEEVTIDVVSSAATMPAWWQYMDPATCRRTSLTWLTAPSPGPSACVDAFQGNAQGGIGAYSMSYQGPHYMKLRCATAVPVASLFDLAPGVEYFAFGLRIDHAHTVGTGACGGCGGTVCLGLATLKLTHSDYTNDVTIPGGMSSAVTWQGGRATLAVSLTRTGYESDMTCLSVTPARNPTWGAVKALYR